MSLCLMNMNLSLMNMNLMNLKIKMEIKMEIKIEKSKMEKSKMEQDSEEQDSEEQDDKETTNISDSRKTAEVWKYFDIRTEHHPDHPVCKSCGQVFSQKTGNSSLKRHLKTHQIFISKKNLQQTTINFQTITPHS